MTYQKKAPQSEPMAGHIINPNGLVKQINDAIIINHFSADATGHLIHTVGTERIGYNAISLKTRQYPATEYGGFVLPPFNLYAINGCVGSQATGVCGIGNDHADRVGENTPTLTGDFQSQNTEGIMPKNSTVSTTEHTQSISNTPSITMTYRAGNMGIASLILYEVNCTGQYLIDHKDEVISTLLEAMGKAVTFFDVEVYTPQIKPLMRFASDDDLGIMVDIQAVTPEEVMNRADEIIQVLARDCDFINEGRRLAHGGAL